MSKDSRPPLLIREQFESTFTGLTDTERGKLLSALMAYQWHGELPSKLSEKLSGIFMVLQSFADIDAQRYEDKREQNRRNAFIRWQKSEEQK